MIELKLNVTIMCKLHNKELNKQKIKEKKKKKKKKKKNPEKKKKKKKHTHTQREKRTYHMNSLTIFNFIGIKSIIIS